LDEVQPVEIGGLEPDGQSPFVLLIHGYNVNQDDAHSSYQGFTNKLGKWLPPSVIDTIWEFYWPGSLPIPGISALSYPVQIGNAKTSADRLAKYIKQVIGKSVHPIPITIVGHSLGCRVVMETLNLLGTLLHQFQVCVMAAAVQVDAINNGGKFNNAIEGTDNRYALHSSKDAILKYAFRAGQTAAFEGFFPEAVGSDGNPQYIWTSISSDTQLGHGDYWDADISADRVASYLGVAVPNRIASKVLDTNKIIDRKIGLQPFEVQGR
jgi:pimeloyl-ACP methyl ester carboxylesterase